MAEENLILEAASSGVIFRVYNGPHQIILEDFQAGSAWILYARIIGETEWIDTNTLFRGAGIRRVEMLEDIEYRLLGGATGAKAYIFGVNGNGPKTTEQIT